MSATNNKYIIFTHKNTLFEYEATSSSEALDCYIEKALGYKKRFNMDLTTWQEVSTRIDDPVDRVALINGLCKFSNDKIIKIVISKPVYPDGEDEPSDNPDDSGEQEDPSTSKTQLKTPHVTLEGNIARWDAIEHATYYELKINDVTTTTPTSNCSVALEADQTLQVRAKGDNINYTDSNWSNKVRTSIGTSLKLATPEVTIGIINGQVCASWPKVEHASGYDCTLPGSTSIILIPSTENPSIIIEKYYIEQPDGKQYAINVVAKGDGENYLDSDTGSAYLFLSTIKLADKEGKWLQDSNGNYLIVLAEGSEPNPDDETTHAEKALATLDTEAASVVISAKGTGILRAYLGDTCVNTATLNDVDSTTFKIDNVDTRCSLTIAGSITELDLSDNKITSIDFENNTDLQRLRIQNNKLSDLDIAPLAGLKYFHIYGNPIIDDYLTNENNCDRIVELMNQLPNRSDESLGSIILYPWYGLETLIYKADGYHYKTPECDFTGIPTEETERVSEGTLCKYPRRLRFVSPAGAVAYTKTECEYGNSARVISSEYYTDEPLTEVFYNSTDQNDPHKSSAYIRNGIEYINSSVEDSILYALVEGYSIADSTKNSDKANWSLKYVTYDKTGKEKEHVLTKYNKLRKLLEATTANKNWFFGSAIQDTPDFKYCQHYFVEAGVQDVWETTQKGFGLTWGIMDCISSCQPDWPRKNIVRYTNFYGNTLNAKIGTDLGSPTITDPRHTQGVVQKYYIADPGDVLWDSDWTWGHGDHIISYLTSTGQQTLKYKGITCEDYLYGTCPNIAVYVLDYVSSCYTTASQFTSDFTAMYIDCTNFDHIAPTRDNMWYIYRKPTGENTYTTLQTVMVKDDSGNYQVDSNGNYIYALVETPNVIIKPEDVCEAYAYDHEHSSSANYQCVSYKDMFEHCDASSWSWGMSSVPSYMKYLLGRFGERRFVAQSSGNEGDNDPASTDRLDGMRAPSAPYGDFNNLNTAKYHSTAFIVGASTKALGPAEFSNDAADVKNYNFAFSDYMTSFGYGIKGYDNTHGLLSFINGTSMSCPNACGIIMLMMNLYKVINPDYSDEPEYIGEQKLSSELKYDQNQLLSGGYGKFSPFMHYVKNNWMTRPANSMVHQTGLGLPSFKAEPSEINISEVNDNIPSTMTIKTGDSTIIENIRDNQKFTLKCNLSPTSGLTSTNLPLHICANIALADSKNLIGLRPGSHIIYLCDNNPAYGATVSPLESNNNWGKPNGFDQYHNTYNYYEMTLNVESNTQLQPIGSHLSLSKADAQFIKLPSSASKKFTVQFKIRFNNESLYDENDPTVHGGLISYGLLHVGSSYLRYVHRSSEANGDYVVNDILAPGNGVNLQYLCCVKLSNQAVSGYSLKIPNKFSNRSYSDLYASTHTTNQAIFLSDRSDINKDNSHVITAKSDGINIYIYLDGTLIITDDSTNAISNLDEIKIPYKLLSPISEDELFANLDKNILAYNRCLSEEEIFRNAAYLLAE